MDDETKLLFKWTTVKPDPIQFKPYSPEFEPVDIYVEVRIPSKYVKTPTNGKIVISPLGMAYAIRRVQNGDVDDENSS